MSIRLRLTLLYSIILALTLMGFNAILYLSQARYTLSLIEEDLARNANQIAMGWGRMYGQPESREPQPWPEAHSNKGNGDVPPPDTRVLGRMRDTVHLLDSAGAVIVQPRPAGSLIFSDTIEAQPLTPVALETLRSGRPWIAITKSEEGRILSHSQPIMSNGNLLGIVQVSRLLADRDRFLNSLGITLGVGTLLVTLTAFAVGWTLAGVTLRPIHRITQTARRIGEARDFSSRVQHHGPDDELGRLARTFNEMLAQLESGYHQVTQALQVQRDFVADVSHELRTPLTTLRGNLALLQRNPPLPRAEQEDILNDLISESERLSRLVADLLTLARADTGRKLELTAVDLCALMADVCRQARLMAPEREMTCAATAPLVVHANEDALKQVLLILCDNAIKHTHSSIHLSAVAEAERIRVRVQDSGPGISPQLRERIFDRFYRGDASRSTPGFGLGLSIARALVEAQHGRLDVESQPGKGSTFVVELCREE